MVTLNLQVLTEPVGIVRILEVVFSCVTFSLMASVGSSFDSFWTWCLFTWCFCFCVSFLIIILEVTNLNMNLHISWDDLTTSFSMLATLMVFTASIICSVFFTCPNCSRLIGACITSFLTSILYAVEVGLTRAKPGEVRGFLSTIPGRLKVLEAFVACIIFTCLGYGSYSVPGLQWCVAVYSLCFIFSFLFIILTICRLLSLFPAPLNKVLSVCNVLAVLMYITAAVIWPIYSFRSPRPNQPSVLWDLKVVVSFFTCFNLIAYVMDTVYSLKLVFLSVELTT